MIATLAGLPITLGLAVPPYTPHAISVSLPTWRDNVGYEEGESRVIDAMVTGYPRFFIHRSIQKLAEVCEKRYGAYGERALLCPSRTVAEQCRAFMVIRTADRSETLPVRLVDFAIDPENNTAGNADAHVASSSRTEGQQLHAVFFPADAFPIAKQFWQHTGMGISSRLAERCLSLLPESQGATGLNTALSPPPSPIIGKSSNRHYSAKPRHLPPVTLSRPLSVSDVEQEEEPCEDQTAYLEERYGRNLPRDHAASAKRTLRRRIAGVLVCDHDSNPPSPLAESSPLSASTSDSVIELGPSSRGIEDVSESDVFLYPTGMSAIWSAHQLALKTRPSAKSVCFGFPYTDTLKILEKWGPGCHFFGHGLDSDIPELEALLASVAADIASDGRPPILALFTEFPSNPLLRSANLPLLRKLADRYDFLIVVDETIGNFVNVSVLPYADIVVSSLTKVFSGDSNVMGGSLVLNPRGRHYATLKASLADTYEDVYFDEDALYLERNSRHFRRRVATINENAEAVCDLLKSRSLTASSSEVLSKKKMVKEVFYPKYTTRSNFDLCRSAALPPSSANFGGLFSVTFVTTAASRAFFDALRCHKGPSLGTSFTLACPYTVLAHYGEFPWAEEYGVEEGLVRVSIGTEDQGELLGIFEEALRAAEIVSV